MYTFGELNKPQPHLLVRAADDACVASGADDTPPVSLRFAYNAFGARISFDVAADACRVVLMGSAIFNRSRRNTTIRRRRRRFRCRTSRYSSCCGCHGGHHSSGLRHSQHPIGQFECPGARAFAWGNACLGVGHSGEGTGCDNDK